jgi:hypothetical protein
MTKIIIKISEENMIQIRELIHFTNSIPDWFDCGDELYINIITHLCTLSGVEGLDSIDRKDDTIEVRKGDNYYILVV